MIVKEWKIIWGLSKTEMERHLPLAIIIKLWTNPRTPDNVYPYSLNCHLSLWNVGSYEIKWHIYAFKMWAYRMMFRWLNSERQTNILITLMNKYHLPKQLNITNTNTNITNILLYEYYEYYEFCCGRCSVHEHYVLTSVCKPQARLRQQLIVFTNMRCYWFSWY